jgi:hypothetical protein
MLVGHQPCSTCRGGHTTWTCLYYGAVVYGPALRVDCRVLAGPAVVRRRMPSRQSVAGQIDDDEFTIGPGKATVKPVGGAFNGNFADRHQLLFTHRFGRIDSIDADIDRHR